MIAQERPRRTRFTVGPMTEELRYEWLLLAVIAARASSFIFSKMALAYLQPCNLLAIRFLLAFVLLCAVFHKKLRQLRRREILAGTIVGVLFFSVMVCELTALESAPSSTVSLLENCDVLFVPVFAAVLERKFPDHVTVCSALMALGGVVCLTVQEGGVSGGTTFGLLSAVLYAIAIIVTSRVTQGSVDAGRIGIVQVGVIGALALIATLLFEQPYLPRDRVLWEDILMLTVVCSGFGFTLQPVAQRHVPVRRAGLFCAVNPAIAALLGAAVLHEQLGALSFLGLALILGSIVLPNLLCRKAAADRG
jgi:drug/metabolite transporter (DMT)-like permease